MQVRTIKVRLMPRRRWWRLRLRVWWQQRQLTPTQRDLLRRVDAEYERAVLFGGQPSVHCAMRRKP